MRSSRWAVLVLHELPRKLLSLALIQAVVSALHHTGGLLLFLNLETVVLEGRGTTAGAETSALGRVVQVWLLSNKKLMVQNRALVWSHKATDFSDHKAEESAKMNFILRIILSRDKDRDSDSHTFSWKINHGFESATHSCVCVCGSDHFHISFWHFVLERVILNKQFHKVPHYWARLSRAGYDTTQIWFCELARKSGFWEEHWYCAGTCEMNCFVNNILNRCWFFFSSFPKGGLFLVTVPAHHSVFLHTAAPLLVLNCVFFHLQSVVHTLHPLQDALPSPTPSTLVTHSSSLCGAHGALDLGQGVWRSCCFRDLLLHGSKKLLLVAQMRDSGFFWTIIRLQFDPVVLLEVVPWIIPVSVERKRQEHLSLEQCGFWDLKQALCAPEELCVVVVNQM